MEQETPGGGRTTSSTQILQSGQLPTRRLLLLCLSVFVCLTLWDFAVVCRVPATAGESRSFGAQ